MTRGHFTDFTVYAVCDGPAVLSTASWHASPMDISRSSLRKMLKTCFPQHFPTMDTEYVPPAEACFDAVEAAIASANCDVLI